MWITALAPSLGAIANLLPFFLVSMEAFNGSFDSTFDRKERLTSMYDRRTHALFFHAVLLEVAVLGVAVPGSRSASDPSKTLLILVNYTVVRSRPPWCLVARHASPLQSVRARLVPPLPGSHVRPACLFPFKKAPNQPLEKPQPSAVAPTSPNTSPPTQATSSTLPRVPYASSAKSPRATTTSSSSTSPPTTAGSAWASLRLTRSRTLSSSTSSRTSRREFRVGAPQQGGVGREWSRSRRRRWRGSRPRSEESGWLMELSTPSRRLLYTLCT